MARRLLHDWAAALAGAVNFSLARRGPPLFWGKYIENVSVAVKHDGFSGRSDKDARPA
jgi:hypothetical protein